ESCAATRFCIPPGRRAPWRRGRSSGSRGSVPRRAGETRRRATSGRRPFRSARPSRSPCRRALRSSSLSWSHRGREVAPGKPGRDYARRAGRREDAIRLFAAARRNASMPFPVRWRSWCRRNPSEEMSEGFDTIIVGGGAAGCVLANRLSASSAGSVLLLEAGQDTAPGGVPSDVLDTYPVSYYNDAYMWPGLKVHWRARENSPLVGFSQGRVMGGGSSVMGMVALRGTPDDYAEWEELGAAGWGWNDVLPFFRKLETELDFPG